MADDELTSKVVSLETFENYHGIICPTKQDVIDVLYLYAGDLAIEGKVDPLDSVKDVCHKLLGTTVGQVLETSREKLKKQSKEHTQYFLTELTQKFLQDGYLYCSFGHKGLGTHFYDADIRVQPVDNSYIVNINRNNKTQADLAILLNYEIAIKSAAIRLRFEKKNNSAVVDINQIFSTEGYHPDNKLNQLLNHAKLLLDSHCNPEQIDYGNELERDPHLPELYFQEAFEINIISAGKYQLDCRGYKRYKRNPGLTVRFDANGSNLDPTLDGTKMEQCLQLRDKLANRIAERYGVDITSRM